MRVMFQGSIYENEDEPKPENSDGIDTSPSEFEAPEVNEDEGHSLKRLDPSIAVKWRSLDNVLYSNIIEFIKFYVGDVEGVDRIAELQRLIDEQFQNLGHEVSSEYNANKGRFKESSNMRDDTTRRKINIIYRFFAYYIIKYNRDIVNWMESLINTGLFNDKTRIGDINGSYSNIDLSLIFEMENSEFMPQYFFILHRDSSFNKGQADFFKDSGSLIDNLAKGAGVFNNLPVMLSVFKRGIYEEYKEKETGTVKRIAIPVGDTEEVKTVIDAMTEIEAIVSKMITVEAIREKFIAKYKDGLVKLNMAQDQIKITLNALRDSIRNGEINTLEDFNKLQQQHKNRSMSDKQKNDLGKTSVRMSKSYGYKLEAILNTLRSEQ